MARKKKKNPNAGAAMMGAGSSLGGAPPAAAPAAATAPATAAATAPATAAQATAPNLGGGASLGGATLGGGGGGAANKKKKRQNKKKGTAGGVGGTGSALGGGAALGAPATPASTPADGSPAAATATATAAAAAAAPSPTSPAEPTETGPVNAVASSLGGAAAAAGGGDILSDLLGGGGGGGGGAAKKKKKKKPKKKAAKKEEVKKGGAPKGLIALLMAQKEEEARVRKEEEERARLEREEQKRLAREEKAREAAAKAKAAAKKERRKANRKTPAQLAAERRLEEARARLGVKMDGVNKPQRVVYASKKRVPRTDEEKAEAERKRAEAEAKRQAAEAEAKRKAEEAAKGGESSEDDWEALLSSDSDDDDGEEGKDAGATKKQSAEPSEQEATTGKGKEEADMVARASPAKSVEPRLRSPVCCILGHVDTGKTSLLDKLRRSNVQGGEAGGITQQIGATYFPKENVERLTQRVDRKQFPVEIRVPGLLIIDTPGHESFSNMRNRGSSLCDIAILVVDIMHGLEPQTLESIKLLRQRKTPFVVALNKVDRLYGWKACRNAPLRFALEQQTMEVRDEFKRRVREMTAAFASENLNAALYYELQGKDQRRYVSMVPTSAMEGEGIPDLLLLLIDLTQKFMGKRVVYEEDLSCTVLEVKPTPGHGTTIDVILTNGVLHNGDTIVVCGFNGPIVTDIRALLEPHPLKELRVKETRYLKPSFVEAARGIKVAAPGLESAVPGSSLLVLGPGDDVDDLKDVVMADLERLKERIVLADRGVAVQSSSLGSLEALLEFLQQMDIPVCHFALGPIRRQDVMRASVMLEHDPALALILAFDVDCLDQETRQFAERQGVQIFTAKIIYHLFDQFEKYYKQVQDERKAAIADQAVFPCVLSIVPNKVGLAGVGVGVGVGLAGVGIGMGVCLSVCGWI
jgi:translation initiation factor 5B